MQFHLNGFEPGEPDIADPAERVLPSGMAGPTPEEVDVLIVGCGPAGLTLAAQLAAFADIKTCIVEQKPSRLLLGQADGVACRTMEMFDAFGFSERVLKEACWITETTFWRPDENKPENIVRSGRVRDVEDGLSEMPHVILNQARVHDCYLDVMRKSPSKLEPYYSRRLLDLEISTAARFEDHAVTVRLERLDAGHEGEIETVRARYVVGCDGARSTVRKSIGRELRGDSANHAWGVMDILAVTDFPDIRFKVLIQSANDGSVLVIPREGGYLVRLYVELTNLDAGERVANRNITSDDLIAKARRILHPHTLDVKEVAWWSVYEIGQRLTDKFDDVPAEAVGTRLPRVFIAGDACHTHSPKAGQGMNVSMQDAFNLGWKLAAVLRGRSAPRLLHSYSAERQAVAKELIDFDREWAEILASAKGDNKGADAAETQDYFVRHGRYTAGTATRYRPSLLTAEAGSSASRQGLVDRHALSFRAGHSARGRQAGSSWPRRQGGRTVPDFRLCRPRRSRCRQFPRSRAVRLPERESQLSREAVHARGRRYRLSDRCPRGVPAGAHAKSPSRRCPRSCSRRKDVTGFATTKRCSAPISRAATTSLRCAVSIGTKAAWWWCGRISMSRTCCRSMAMPNWRRISTGSCCGRDRM